MFGFGPINPGFSVFVLYFDQIVSQNLKKIFKPLCESQLMADLGILSS